MTNPVVSPARASGAQAARPTQSRMAVRRHAVHRVIGLVPVGVERELHPQPPDRREQQHEPGQGAKVQVALEGSAELPDRTGEDQVEEQLQPARPPFIAVVAIGGAQRWRAEPDRGAGQIADPAHVPTGWSGVRRWGGRVWSCHRWLRSRQACLSTCCTARAPSRAFPRAWARRKTGSPVRARSLASTLSRAGPWHAGVQPAAAACSQQRAGGRQQAHGMLGIILAAGEPGQRLQVVGRAGLIAGLGREDQPFLELPGRPGQVAPRPGWSAPGHRARRGWRTGRPRCGRRPGRR